MLSLKDCLPTYFNRNKKEDMDNNPHRPLPGTGVAFWEHKESRKSPQGPDFKGQILLEMDYKAGETLKFAAWQKDTKLGVPLLSIKEDNWAKKKKAEMDQPREVQRGYAAPQRKSNPYKNHDDDNDVPF